jgi:hypothetical protein
VAGVLVMSRAFPVDLVFGAFVMMAVVQKSSLADTIVGLWPPRIPPA